MKYILTFAALFFLQLSFIANCQTDSSKLLHKTFKITITNFSEKIQKAYLTAILDTSLVITQSPVQFGRSNLLNNPTEKYDLSNISQVIIRKKGSTGRGFLTGAIVGGFIGVLSGLISGDDPGITNSNTGEQWFSATAGEKAAVFGALGTFCGSITGGIIGALAHKKFIISGKKENFDTMKTTVLEKAYRKS